MTREDPRFWDRMDIAFWEGARHSNTTIRAMRVTLAAADPARAKVLKAGLKLNKKAKGS